MALSSMGKLGLAAGGGVVATLATDALITYYAPKVDDTTGKATWYTEYSNYLGAGVGVLAAGGLYLGKVVDKEQALVMAIASVGTALAVPAHDYVAKARIEADATAGRRLGGAKSRELLKAGAVAA